MAKFATYSSVAFGDLCVLSRYVILIQIPLCHPCGSGAVSIPLSGVLVTGLVWFPGSVRANAGAGSGPDSTGRSTRAAGLVLTPTPFGAGLVRRERAIGVGGVAVFSDVLNGR